MPEISAFCPGCGQPVHETLEQLRANGSADAAMAAGAYFLIVPAIVFLFVPAIKRSLFVRFHAWQAVLFGAAVAVLGLVFRLLYLLFSILGSFGFLVAWLTVGIGAIAVAIAWVVLVTKAAQGQGYELPIIGPVATRLTHKDISADLSKL